MVVRSHKGLDKVLLKDFSALPVKNVDYGDYAVINVSPSVVPAYFPSFRVFNYNVSAGAVQEALERKERRRRGENFWRPPPHGHRKPDPGKSRDKQCKKAKHKDSWRCHFSKDDWHSDPEAPSRKNGLMTPLGFAQVSLGLFKSFSVAGFLRHWRRFCLPGVHRLLNHSFWVWYLRLSYIFRHRRTWVILMVTRVLMPHSISTFSPPPDVFCSLR